jgi:hypothetical protein
VSKENGFVPIRRGLWEHLRDGRMSPFEALAFVYICSQADTRTGVWKGSAGALVTELGFQPRTARDLLERMEHGGYIRRFVSQGMRHCYPILIHKFPVTQGEHNGEVLDALSSTKQDGCLELRYISCEVHGEVDGEVHGKVHASQRRKENGERRQEKKKDAETASAALPVAFTSSLLVVNQAQDVKLADVYPWVDRPHEYAKMALWVEANRPGRKIRNALAFCQNWFNKIPCPKGGSNGSAKKLTGEALTAANLKAAGYVQ